MDSLERTAGLEVKCPYCPYKFKKQGYTTHFNACEAKHLSRERDLASLKAMEAEEHIAKRARRDRLRARSGPKMSGSNTRTVNPTADNPLHSASLSHEAHFMSEGLGRLSEDVEVIESISNLWPEMEHRPCESNNVADAPLSTSHFYNMHETLSDTDDHVPALTEESDSSPEGEDGYALDSFKTVYHPNSGRPSRVEEFEDFTRVPAANSRPIVFNDRPWDPFRSRDEFEFAEVTLQAGMSKREVEVLLRLLNRVAKGQADFAFTDYASVKNAWDMATTRHTPFEKHEITVPFKKEEFKYTVLARNLMDWAVEQVRDPLLAPHFQWDAQKLFRWNGQSWVRFYDEPCTGDLMWNHQSRIPPNKTPLGIQIYADTAKLSSFGTQKGHAVVARIINLDTSVRNGDGLGGGMVVGFLPVVEEMADHSGKTGWADFKATVYHKSLKKFIETLETAAKVGEGVRCGDDIERSLWPFVLLSADYEEQALMALIRGALSLFPCPVCLVPAEELSKLGMNWPLRTTEHARALVTRKESVAAKQTSLKEVGLRPVYNVLWDLPGCNPYQAVSFDPLHAYHSGLFGHHLWGQFKLRVEEAPGRKAAVMFDKQVSAFPRWPDFTHFDNGALHVSFTDGSKYQDLSKVIVYAAYNIFTPKTNKKGYALLKAIRKYTECDMYASLVVHTTETLDSFTGAIIEFGELISEYAALCADDEDVKSWNFPKVHTHWHAPDDVRLKGALRNVATNINEKQHHPVREIYLDRTNFRDVMEQIAAILHQFGCATIIRARIDAHDAYLKSLATAREDQEERASPFQFSQVYAGARQAPTTFSELEAQYRKDPAFDRFRIKLNPWLTQLLADPERSQHLPHNAVKFTANDTIIESRYVKVDYESYETWREVTDRLRCSPSFFGHERRDAVIFQVSEDEFAFAKLIFVFVCSVQGQLVPVALVQPLKHTTGPPRHVDQDLGFCRLRASARKESIFIPLRSVVRGALVIQEPGKPRDYLAVDVIDSDMFLRLRELFPNRGLS